MSHKKVNNFSTKKEDYKFQVSCVSYMNLEKNKTLKDQVDKCLYNQFDVTTSQQMSKTLQQDNTHDIDLIMFYNNRK